MDLWQDVVVAAYCTDGPYRQEAERLRKSVERFEGLRCCLMFVPNRVKLTWKEAVRLKPSYVLQAMRFFSDRPILFVDADAILLRDPRTELPNTWRNEIKPFSIHQLGNEVLSGTIVVAPEPKAKSIVNKWNEVTVKTSILPRQPQVLLRTIPEVDLGLGPEWCWVFDRTSKRYDVGAPIVMHLQASREYREDRKCRPQLIERRRHFIQAIEKAG